MTDLDTVGQTALGVAYVRAYESRLPNPLFTDPIATAIFDENAAPPIIGDASKPDSVEGLSDDDERKLMYYWIVGRTVFLDDVCALAAKQGVKQYVILGSGLDARAFRLDLGEGAVVYEVDRPDVADAKESIIDEHSLRPRNERRVVRTDLADDWLRALEDTGFRADLPTCWIVEGVLVYLDDDVVSRVIEGIAGATEQGSHLGVTLRGHHNAGIDDSAFASIRELWHDNPGIPKEFARSGWNCTLSDNRTILGAHGRRVASTPVSATLLGGVWRGIETHR